MTEPTFENFRRNSSVQHPALASQENKRQTKEEPTQAVILSPDPRPMPYFCTSPLPFLERVPRTSLPKQEHQHGVSLPKKGCPSQRKKAKVRAEKSLTQVTICPWVQSFPPNSSSSLWNCWHPWLPKSLGSFSTGREEWCLNLYHLALLWHHINSSNCHSVVSTQNQPSPTSKISKKTEVSCCKRLAVSNEVCCSNGRLSSKFIRNKTLISNCLFLLFPISF